MLAIPFSEDLSGGIPSAERKAAIREGCIAEILTFWDRLNNAGEICVELKSHFQALRNAKEQSTKENGLLPDLFRRSLDDRCFLISCRDPLSLSDLGEQGTRYLHLSAGGRHLVARFNWLNVVSIDIKSLDFWIEYHRDTVKVFDKILDRSRKMLRELGDKETDPAVFRFHSGKHVDMLGFYADADGVPRRRADVGGESAT